MAIEKIGVGRVRGNPWQPRRVVGDVKDLAKSIEREGLLQVPVGRMIGDEIAGELVVQLAFGHRRWKACELELKWSEIDIDVREITDEQMVQYALAENRERVAVEEIEELEAAAKALGEVEGLKQQDVAAWMGWSRSTLTKRLQVLQVPDVVLERVRAGGLSVRAGLVFLGLRCYRMVELKDRPGTERRTEWHDGVVKKVMGNLEDGATVERVEGVVARSRPADWHQVDEKVKENCHRMKCGEWNCATAHYFVCDAEIVKRLEEEARVRREKEVEGRVEALDGLRALPEGAITSLLVLMRPRFPADEKLLDVMGLKKEGNFSDWSGRWMTWAVEATPDDLMAFVRWKIDGDE